MSDIPYVDIVKSRRRNWSAYIDDAIDALEAALAKSEARSAELLERLNAAAGETVALRAGVDDIRKSTRPPAGSTVADTAEALAARLDFVRYRAETLLARPARPHTRLVAEVLEAALKWFHRKRDDARCEIFYTIEEHHLYYKLEALYILEALEPLGSGVTRS